MSGFPRKSGSGGDGIKSPRLSMHGQAEDCQSHQNVGQGASPGKQGGQEKRAVNKGADGAAFGKRAGQPDSCRDGYKLKNLSEEHMTGIKFRNHSKKKSIILAVKKAKVLVKNKQKSIISNQRNNSMTSLICFNRFSALVDAENIKEEEDYEIINEKIEKKTEVMKNKKKKRKTTKKSKSVKQKKIKSDIITTEPKFSETWARCGKCFNTHFPSRRLCRWQLRKRTLEIKDTKTVRNLVETEVKLILHYISILEKGKTSKAAVLVKVNGDKHISRDNFWPYRLKGGADSNEVEIQNYLSTLQQSTSIMVNKAIENAKFHGINMHHGVPNMADGNCAFESIIDNISTRSCFEERFEGTPDHWRSVWMSIIQKIAYNEWHGNMSHERWNAEFEILKQSRTYEVQLGDLVVPGIAHCTHKNILIFNTSEQAHSPIYVIPATKFGGTANTDIPVCLAYNQVHYEGLVPSSDVDIAKTIDLTKQFLYGEYNISINDIPAFQNKSTEIYDKEFPILRSQSDKRSNKSKVSEEVDIMQSMEENHNRDAS